MKKYKVIIGIVDGEPKIELEHIMRMRADMAPEWTRVEPNGGYRVEIKGSSTVSCDVKLGLPGGEGSAFDDAMAMTAARCVNAVEPLVQATPGFKNIFDLPPLTGKYTMRHK